MARARPQAQRDHRFHAGAELGDDRAEDARDLRRAAGRQPRRDADRHVLPARRGRARARHSAISRLVHPPGRDRRAADRRSWRCSSRCSAPTNMSAGGSCSSGSSAGSSSPTWAIRNPLYTYGGTPNVPLSDFVGAGSFWMGPAVLQFYWLCFAVILAVIAHLLWPRGTDLAVRVRLRADAAPRDRAAARDCRRRRRRDGRDRRLRLLQHQGPQPLPDQRRGARNSRRTTSANI